VLLAACFRGNVVGEVGIAAVFWDGTRVEKAWSTPEMAPQARMTATRVGANGVISVRSRATGT
jgi:hypothetical protein